MANRDIVAIGTSAGGVGALRFLAERLPAEFPASVLVTIHLSAQFPSSLDDILGKAGPLPAKFASTGLPLQRGVIFLAPPDRHLIIEGDTLILGQGPRENNSRPAIDPMLRSIAACCGPRSIGAVLTGTLSDGTSGLQAVKRCGGTSVVQDPSDADFPDMPRNAINGATPDHVVRLEDMPALFQRLVAQPEGNSMPVPENIRVEVAVAKGTSIGMEAMDRLGRRSVLTCPDCNGVMWEMEDGELLRFRCHVGHAYAAESMSLSLDESLRRGMASALRALEERVALAHKLQKQAVEGGHRLLEARWASKAREAEIELAVVRDAMARMDAISAASALETNG
jgi:two-component system, chemotaxis family, protein-glutamate methylesterase/glutaminase